MPVDIPHATLAWLTGGENPAVAVLTRRELLGEPASADIDALWARRNEYAPVKHILELMKADGSWAPPTQDYRKYGGSLWQIHFLGELYASGDDERVQAAAAYAFSRQLPDGSWSCTGGRPAGSIPCLTANVGRALARLGFARDERVLAALGYVVGLYRTLGCVDCRGGPAFHLNGYCHMLTPKELLFLAEVPRDLWPDGAGDLRQACIDALRDKRVFHSLPAEARAYQDAVFSMPAAEQQAFRERFLAEHQPLTYGPKPGWLRLGYPLSYNSDVLGSLYALARHGEPRRREYEDALGVVRAAADGEMRWTLRTTFNGKMLADVEEKGRPSRWLTWRALSVLRHFEAGLGPDARSSQ
ncbi:MAG: hypothetical protein JXP72_00750 [Coriobacteriia bacterium]|nr:hypothetical protein [Coriobacteriia bacterium]